MQRLLIRRKKRGKWIRSLRKTIYLILEKEEGVISRCILNTINNLSEIDALLRIYAFECKKGKYEVMDGDENLPKGWAIIQQYPIQICSWDDFEAWLLIC